MSLYFGFNENFFIFFFLPFLLKDLILILFSLFLIFKLYKFVLLLLYNNKLSPSTGICSFLFSFFCFDNFNF